MLFGQCGAVQKKQMPVTEGTDGRGAGFHQDMRASRCFMLEEGLWAEVKVANQHLRLFAERNAQGVQASVYNVISKTWIAPSESVEDIDQGKARAETHAREYLKETANVELPTLQWKASRAV